MPSRRTLIIANALVASMILAIIVIPILALPQIGDSARLTCASSLSSMALGLLQYSQDNDEKLPPRQNMSGPDGSLVSWRYLIYPYVKSRGSFQCPLNSVQGSPPASAPLETCLDLTPSYSVNATHGDARSFGPFADKYHVGFAIADAADPPQTIAVVETTSAFNDFNPLFPQGFAQKANAQTRAGNLFSGHNRRTMIAFLDGHTDAMPPSQTLSQTGVNPWTVDNKPFSPADQLQAKITMEYSERVYHDVREDAALQHQGLAKYWTSEARR
jgi:prepilin-type processing-associated H-X9-DG protein